MTDHSQEAVVERIVSEAMQEQGGNPADAFSHAFITKGTKDILARLQPGDQLQNELVAVSRTELRILTKLAAAVQKDDKPHMAKLLSDLEDWQNGR